MKIAVSNQIAVILIVCMSMSFFTTVCSGFDPNAEGREHVFSGSLSFWQREVSSGTGQPVLYVENIRNNDAKLSMWNDINKGLISQMTDDEIARMTLSEVIPSGEIKTFSLIPDNYGYELNYFYDRPDLWDASGIPIESGYDYYMTIHYYDDERYQVPNVCPYEHEVVTATLTPNELAGPPASDPEPPEVIAEPVNPQNALVIEEVRIENAYTPADVALAGTFGNMKISDAITGDLKSADPLISIENRPFDLVVTGRATGGDLPEPLYVVITPPNGHTGFYSVERLSGPITIAENTVGTWRFRITCLDAMVDADSIDLEDFSTFGTLCTVPDVFRFRAFSFVEGQAEISDGFSNPVISVRKKSLSENILDEVVGEILSTVSDDLYGLLSVEDYTITAFALLDGESGLSIRETEEILGDSTDLSYSEEVLKEAYAKQAIRDRDRVQETPETPGFLWIAGIGAIVFLLWLRRD